MKIELNDIVEGHCKRIREHSEKIYKAQQNLHRAVRNAKDDFIRQEQLYC